MNPLSGYQFRRVNAGNIQNQGVEMILNARILDNPQKLTWDMTANFVRNRKKIVELYDDIQVYSFGGYDDVRIKDEIGRASCRERVGPYGLISADAVALKTK